MLILALMLYLRRMSIRRDPVFPDALCPFMALRWMAKCGASGSGIPIGSLTVTGTDQGPARTVTAILASRTGCTWPIRVTGGSRFQTPRVTRR